MTIKHAGDAALAGAVAMPVGAWATQLETGLTILVLAISAVAGIYSVVWNRLRINNERRTRDEQSERNDSRRTP